jgi:hypothetical protein
MPEPFPNLSSYRPQRRWLPPPPGGFRPRKPKRGKKPSREAATFRRLEPGLSRAGVIVMGVALAVVAVLVVIIAATRL